MKLFLSSLKRHIRLLLMLLVCGGVAAAVLFLYRVPREGLWYAFLLCLAVGALFLVLGFCRYRSRHKALQRVLELMGEGSLALPEAEDALEADYQTLLNALEEDRRRTVAEAAAAVKLDDRDARAAAERAVSRFWNTPMRTGRRRYYDNCLYFFAMLALSGKYVIY